jgi:hypothetical protein
MDVLTGVQTRKNVDELMGVLGESSYFIVWGIRLDDGFISSQI